MSYGTTLVLAAADRTWRSARQAERHGRVAAIDRAFCIVTFDLDGLIQDANANFLEATGFRMSELRGKPHGTVVPAATAQGESYRHFWQALAAGQHQSGEFRHVAKNGREVWLQSTYTPVLDTDGRPLEIVQYATIVTDRKFEQADLQGQIAAIGKSHGLISFDLAGNILDANVNFCQAVGYAHDDLCGQHHRILLEPEYAASADYAQFWETLRAGHFVSGLYKRLRKDGEVAWIQASYNPILDQDGVPTRIIKFATDVTSYVALAEAYEDAKRQSQHDPATALPNRVRLLAFLTAILAQPERRLNVLYLDLDRFKPVNDSYGHQAGDHVLAEIADRLRRILQGDQLAARIGGDEFIIAAPDLDNAEVEALCQQLIEAVSAPIRFNDTELRVGASIGVATSHDAHSPDGLLRCADAAMYRSKQSGRGLFSFYAASLNDRLTASRSSFAEMERCLAEGQFFLDYQPRFNTSSNQIVSVEALVRWNHPERGLVPPLEFIPGAERSGFIVRLGEWVLREACRAATAWPGLGISVNVSPAQFQSGNFVTMVETTLAQTGLHPSRLELEITESVVLGDVVTARETLDGLKHLGVKIAMDDFGTGYSSLSSLRTFPFDAIKIDRQFIHDMDTRESGRDVVQAILALARALDVTVTAEGVETANQLSMLTDDRCAELQGFLLARPMPPDQISILLRDRRALPAPAETSHPAHRPV